MKTVIIFLSIMFFTANIYGQDLHLNKVKDIKKPFYTHSQIDVNYLNYPIKGINTNGIGVNLAVVFRDRLATGISIDATDAYNMPFDNVFLTEGAVFEYTQISWLNEVLFHPNSRIDFSFPLKLGLGHASYVNDRDFFFGQTLFSKRGMIRNDFFFVVEPGVNTMVHLLKNIDLNIGGSYRLVTNANGFVSDKDFINYSVHIGLRFRIPSKRH